MNTKQRQMKRKNAQQHTKTQGAKKRAALTGAIAASARARKPERKSVLTQMRERGYSLDVRGRDAQHIALHGAESMTPRTHWFRATR